MVTSSVSIVSLVTSGRRTNISASAPAASVALHGEPNFGKFLVKKLTQKLKDMALCIFPSVVMCNQDLKCVLVGNGIVHIFK